MQIHLLSGLLVLFFVVVVIQSLSGQINDGGSLPKSMTMPGFPKEAIPSIVLPSLRLERFIKEDEVNDQSGLKAPRVGVLLSSDIGLQNGHWTQLENGDRVWRARIKVPNAMATNLYFDDFYLPKGAKMHVYSPDHSEILGGFGAHNSSPHGRFVTALIHSDESIIEYYEPLEVSGQGSIHISEVNHAYRMVDKPDPSVARVFGESDDCEVNVNCSTEGDGKAEQRDAVVLVYVKTGMSVATCSGTMVNNVHEDCTPYLLTALHCANDNGNIASQADFDQWIFYFNYQGSGCLNPDNESLVPNNTITGANIIASNGDPTVSTGSDFLLLELQTDVPADYNVFFAGWNASSAVTMGGFGIHHPKGDIKKISTFSVTTTFSAYSGGGPETTHRFLTWDATTNGHGVTEGGSSGSGLFDNNGSLVGTLTGGFASCGNLEGADYYGSFHYHWDQNGVTADMRLKDWLDPDDSGATMLGGTYFPCFATTPDAYMVMSSSIVYHTLAEAISHAELGDTILLIGHAQETAPITEKSDPRTDPIPQQTAHSEDHLSEG